ncbi:MAG: PspC domain-containing protein [Methanomicrobiales archaeon]|nr:PspC domain-containing protein [Methanomicrobiales archaeon]MDI6876985.1 PspC domain-containing protein [Methanomicrobiales archaeon]
MKRLYRSIDDRIIAGVAGGIGEYYEIDPTLIRLAWVVLTVITGFIPGIVAYILAWLIVPEEGEAPGVIEAEAEVVEKGT